MQRTLEDVAQVLGPEAFQRRLDQANREAALFDQVLARCAEGVNTTQALQELVPDRPAPSMARRLRRYEQEGRDGLVSRRYGPPAERKLTDEALGGLRALAVNYAHDSAADLTERLSKTFDRPFGVSTVQAALKALGLARPRGRPVWHAVEVPEDKPASAVVELLAVAGAELLKAVDQASGAVDALTRGIERHLERLPEPEGPIEDDRGHRDERGRFLASYNAARPRLEPELGDRFNSVVERRAAKDLRKMRVVDESYEVHHRKNLAVVLLPVLVRGARWSELAHWRGNHLGELVGVPYQPSTLDKYLRELKLGGCAVAAREAVASFWLGQEGTPRDPATGIVVVYADTSTKPIWTHHWTRSTKVSKTGRVMPANSLITLHSGVGTPLVFRSFSGQVSLTAEIERTLGQYERHAGEGTAQRVVVMDREAHALWLFELLDSKKWGFVIPLRKSVLGPRAKFEDLSDWQPYGEQGDEVCDAWLWLNDGRRGQPAKRVRVLGRRRFRTGKVAWFATNRPAAELSAEHGIRLYFERWPNQEHVYRNGSGGVGLDIHHGYGKRKVDNVVVLDRLERLAGHVRRLQTDIAKHDARAADLRGRLDMLRGALDRTGPEIERDRAELDTAIGRESAPDLRRRLRQLAAWDTWLQTSRRKAERLQRQIAKAEQNAAAKRLTVTKKQAEIELLDTRRQIFTVDVDLDEILTAYKLTFMNLCQELLTRHLGVDMELETLIDAVLTLPGERVRTPEVETVRIYRQERDPRTMDAVERACASLTALGLRRPGELPASERTLRFEVVPRPLHRVADPSDPGS